MRWRLLDRNPADATSPPCLKRPQAATCNHDQVRRFLAAAANDGYGPIWLLAAMTGLRRGELLGLQWEDVDLGRGVLRVRRSLVEIGSRLIIQEPKTPSGRRVVRLGRSCVVALEAHRAQALARRSAPDTAPPAGTGYVFTTARGGPIAPRNLIRRFHMLTCRAGVPRIRFHELRHTHATLLLEDGKHSKVVSERLGHASVMITLDTYSHVLPDMQREA